MKLYTAYPHHTPEPQLTEELFVPSLRVEDLPDKVNWNEKGWLTEIKNQVSTAAATRNHQNTFVMVLI